MSGLRLTLTGASGNRLLGLCCGSCSGRCLNEGCCNSGGGSKLLGLTAAASSISRSRSALGTSGKRLLGLCCGGRSGRRLNDGSCVPGGSKLLGLFLLVE